MAQENTASTRWKGMTIPVFHCLPQGLKLQGWFATAQKGPAAWPQMLVVKEEIIHDTCEKWQDGFYSRWGMEIDIGSPVKGVLTWRRASGGGDQWMENY